ncbi:MAG: ATP-dependent helicase, partial [Flavobacteriaceae bacterium]|nr:ATP-dependent helicase [Flavobacteriaceae bacterium]
GTTQQEAINYGNTLHEIMALIYCKTDVEAALEKVVENGVITVNESKTFRKTIQEIINHQELVIFFDGKNKVLNEQLILDSEFGNLKPDKIVIQGNNILILDYKTGEFSDNHKKQIEKYTLTLQKMNYSVIKKVLVYTNQSIQVVLL